MNEQQPTNEELNRLRNVWAAAYNNFDQYLKAGGHSIPEINSLLLAISAEVFTTAGYMHGENDV